jgi:hypothetical protein
MSLVDQVNALPGTGVPEALVAAAVSWIEAPGSTVAASGDTVTDATRSSIDSALSVPQPATLTVEIQATIHETPANMFRAGFRIGEHLVGAAVEALNARPLQADAASTMCPSDETR